MQAMLQMKTIDINGLREAYAPQCDKRMMGSTSENRSMTPDELRLVRWMLEHGTPEAKSFLPQLDAVRVTPWRCPCGCASFDFAIEGNPQTNGGIHLIADFLFGDDATLNGIFVFTRSGVLAGVEVYGLAAEASKTLPAPEVLRPIDRGSATR